MGIYIPNMEMPKDGRITIQIGSDGAVYFVEECTILAEKYEKSSHAIPLPEGHGRLGDLETAEAILHNKTFDLAGTSAEYNALNWALRQIKALPTIVPAEGGTDDDGNA